MNIDYTLWPNADGNLGSIKVQIPDGVNTFWPEGDALVHNFFYKDGKLAGFVDTKALTVNESKSTVINYDYFDIELPFTEGEIAITRGERSKYFNVRYNSINDDNVVITLKYRGCETVDDVKAVDPDYLTNDIVDGVWSEGLGDLTNGGSMFMYCSLESFNSDLSSLTNGELMFSDCCSLTSFNADLSSLLQGYFKDITGWNGAVVGTAYEQATDEIEVSVLEVSDQLSIEVKFLEPEKSPYSSSEQMSIGSYKIVNAEGDTIVKDAASELAEVVDGKATIKLSLDQLPAGSYKLLISELISEKKADQPLTLSGNWKCEFVR